MRPAHAANCQGCGQFTAETNDWPYLCEGCKTAGLALGNAIATGPTFGGVKVIQVDTLPPNTMMVSRDVYQVLAATPEERAAKADQLLKNMRAIADQLRDLTGGGQK